jgi:hypothetical protein
MPRAIDTLRGERKTFVDGSSASIVERRSLSPKRLSASTTCASAAVRGRGGRASVGSSGPVESQPVP